MGLCEYSELAKAVLLCERCLSVILPCLPRASETHSFTVAKSKHFR